MGRLLCFCLVVFLGVTNCDHVVKLWIDEFNRYDQLDCTQWIPCQFFQEICVDSEYAYNIQTTGEYDEDCALHRSRTPIFSEEKVNVTQQEEYPNPIVIHFSKRPSSVFFQVGTYQPKQKLDLAQQPKSLIEILNAHLAPTAKPKHLQTLYYKLEFPELHTKYTFSMEGDEARNRKFVSTKIQFQLTCAPDYYGVNCTTFCRPENPNYFCDEITGEKINVKPCVNQPLLDQVLRPTQSAIAITTIMQTPRTTTTNAPPSDGTTASTTTVDSYKLEHNFQHNSGASESLGHMANIDNDDESEDMQMSVFLIGLTLLLIIALLILVHRIYKAKKVRDHQQHVYANPILGTPASSRQSPELPTNRVNTDISTIGWEKFGDDDYNKHIYSEPNIPGTDPYVMMKEPNQQNVFYTRT